MKWEKLIKKNCYSSNQQQVNFYYHNLADLLGSGFKDSPGGE